MGWRPSSGGWISGNCPMCVLQGEKRPDTRRRGGFMFNEEGWGFNCFNCRYSTGWTPGHGISIKAKALLKEIGISEADIQRVSIELLKEKEEQSLLNPIAVKPPLFRPEWPETVLPSDAQFLEDLSNAQVTKNLKKGLLMLSDRHLLHWTDWAYTDDFKYRNRMILPYRWHGKLVGYTARYIGEPQSKNMPKYLTSKPPGFVFNLDRQVADRKVVIVTEGDFDAITIDGVALGSNSLHQNQASLINQLNKEVILLPDADEAGNKLIDAAIREGWNVSFPKWMRHCKDAGAAAQRYGRAFVLKSILDSTVSSSLKIRLLAKKFLR